MVRWGQAPLSAETARRRQGGVPARPLRCGDPARSPRVRRAGRWDRRVCRTAVRSRRYRWHLVSLAIRRGADGARLSFCAAQSFCMHGLDAGSRLHSHGLHGDLLPMSYLIDMSMIFCIGRVGTKLVKEVARTAVRAYGETVQGGPDRQRRRPGEDAPSAGVRLFYLVDRAADERASGNSDTDSRGRRRQMATTGITGTKPPRGEPPRLLKASAGTAALLGALQTNFPGGAFAQAAGPEVTKAVLGYIALMDASPLVIAKEKGLFAKHGMPDVEVPSRPRGAPRATTSCSAPRSNGIDGAHILTPMPYLISAGKVTQNNVPTPMYILARLNLDGQASRSPTNTRTSRSARRLAAQGGLRQEEGRRQGSEGRDDLPGRHPRSLDPLLARRRRHRSRQGRLDHRGAAAADGGEHEGRQHGRFCVGEPWNEQLVNQNIGFTACTTGEIWSKHPEKALGLRAEWVDKNPKAAKALLMAVMEAQQWCDKPENSRKWPKSSPSANGSTCRSPTSSAASRATSTTAIPARWSRTAPSIMKFWQDHASYPFKSHDPWFVTEDIRWGKFEPTSTSRRWSTRSIARTSGARPPRRSRSRRRHPASTSRGKETFFDGKVFDPDDPRPTSRA